MDADCWFSIFDCLNLKELVNCCLISKQFCRIANNNHFWIRFLKSDFQINEINRNNYRKYKEYYTLNKFLVNYGSNLTDTRNANDIYLMCRGLRDIPSQFGLLINLRVIHLSGNYLKSLPSVIPQCYNLLQSQDFFNFFAHNEFP